MHSPADEPFLPHENRVFGVPEKRGFSRRRKGSIEKNDIEKPDSGITEFNKGFLSKRKPLAKETILKNFESLGPGSIILHKVKSNEKTIQEKVRDKRKSRLPDKRRD
ncbi:hypothetical protein D4Q76_00505 [archaeon]|nr:MAG: hypothetical protein D4Q76_00505 [archaeon]